MRDLVRLPRAHLHVHLENAVRWSTLRDIGVGNGVTVPEHLADGRFGFETFAGFLAQNALVRACLLRRDDFFRVAYELCQDEAADGTSYVEVSFTAAAHGEVVGDRDMPLAGVLDGLEAGAAAFGLDWRVILDHSRRRPLPRAWETLRLAVANQDRGVVAVGLSGDETYPAAPFAEVFRTARSAGLHLTHHAGEAAGPASIREALDLGAERLGHGIRVLDDTDLVADVRARGVALEVCPTSNVALGMVPTLADHPLPRLIDAGLAVTLNVDIPAMIATTLSGEFANARRAFGLTDASLAELARTSIRHSFADHATRDRLLPGVDAWLAGTEPAGA